MAFQIKPYGEGEDLSLYLFEQFRAFEIYLQQRLGIVEYFSAPLNPTEGMIVMADGVSWDPGSGGGFYGYHDGAWVFLG
jgi:hypothetical protein